MNALLLLVLAAAPASGLSEADEKFLQDLAATRGFSLGKPSGARPLPDGSKVLFLRAEARKSDRRLYAFDVATGKTAELVTPADVLKGGEEKLSAEEKARRERMRLVAKGFTGFQISKDGKQALVELSGRAYLVPVAGGPIREVAGPSPNGEPIFDAELSPDGASLSYVRGGELWVAPLASPEKAHAVTGGATPDKTHAQAEFVAQEELGRFSGYAWAPDGKHLVYEEADTSGVEKLWFGDLAHPESKPEPTPYPRPGKANAVVSFGVVPAQGGKTVWLDWDKAKWPYVGHLAWWEGGPLTLVVLTRDQKDLALLAADPATGKTRALLTEHDDTWVNLPTGHHGGGGFAWLRDGSGFLWGSERGGSWQLELHGKDGALVRTLTKPGFGLGPLVKVDEKRRVAISVASSDAIEHQVFEIPLDGGEPRPLTRGPASHSGTFARDAGVWVRNTSAAAGARGTAEVVRADGSVAGELASVAEPPPFAPRPELLRVTERGIWTSLIRPRGFDPKKKYPVIVQVYGGPGVQIVHANPDGHLLEQWIADHGYLVFSADGRGSSGRGREWERAIDRKLASVPLEDQVAALQARAAKEPSMDLARVGIWGGSFGGYLAALAVMRRPDVYRAGFASAPPVDWMNYDTAYTERYLGVPGPGDTVYRENGLLAYAPSLTRPLLLEHGTADDNVHFSEALLLADALLRAGKPFDFLPLVGMTHLTSDPALSARYYARVFAFFEKNL